MFEYSRAPVRPLTLCLAAAAVAACGSDASRVSLELTSSAPQSAGALTASDAQGSEIVVETARAYIRHIELDLADGTRCDDVESDLEGPVTCSTDKLRIAGPFAIDLVTGVSEPSLADIAIPPGTYARADVRFDDAEPSEGLIGSTDALAGETLLASGTLEVDGTPTRFEMILGFNEDARFEGSGGVTVDGDASQLAMLLDVNQWFSGAPITRCLDDGDLTVSGGKLLVADSSGSCSDVENGIKEAIKTSGQLDR